MRLLKLLPATPDLEVYEAENPSNSDLLTTLPFLQF